MINFSDTSIKILKEYIGGKEKQEIADSTGSTINCVTGTILRYNQYKEEEIAKGRFSEEIDKEILERDANIVSKIVKKDSVQTGTNKSTSINKFENAKDGITVAEVDKITIHENVNYKELFSGYDTFYGITYSSSPDYIYEIIKDYKYAEIIFGTRNTLNNEMYSVFAMQKVLVEEIKKNKRFEYFKDRIKDGSLKLFVPLNTVSHEKVFILKNSETDKKRTVFGSANMSRCAFDGRQREIVLFSDETETYRYFKGLYEDLKLDCTNEISLPILENDDDSIKNTPVAVIAKVKERVYVDKVEEADKIEIQITQKISEINEELRADISEIIDRRGEYPKITYDAIDAAARRISFNQTEDKKKTKELPNFEFNLEEDTFALNGLNFKDYFSESFPNADAKNDIQIIDKYVEGLKSFNGDVEHTVDIFNMLLTYCFVSPFLTIAKRSFGKNENRGLTPTNKCPEFFVIYGDAAAGKSCMASFVQKLMFGQTFLNSEAKEFTPSKIREIRKLSKGVPVIINDLDSNRWNKYSDEIIKEDTFELDETCRLKSGKIIKTNPPACIITANRINTIKPEIAARSVMAHVTASIDTIDRIKKQTVVDKLASGITPAFYIRFLETFLPFYKEAIERFKDGKDVDFFEIASKCIRKVTLEELGFIPDWMKELNIEKLFGRENVNYNGINKLQEFVLTNPEKCLIKNEKIIFDFENQYDAKAIKQELPTSMLATVSGRKLVCNLKETNRILHTNIGNRKDKTNKNKNRIKNFNTKHISDILTKNNVFKNLQKNSLFKRNN